MRISAIVGCVRDLESSGPRWATLLGGRLRDSTQLLSTDLKIATIEFDTGPVVELLQPLTADHDIMRHIEANGEGLFALALEVPDLAIAQDVITRANEIGEPVPSVLLDLPQMRELIVPADGGLGFVVAYRQIKSEAPA